MMALRPAPTPASSPSAFVGRRRGRALRPMHRRLLETRLPTLEIPPGDGPLNPERLFASPRRELWLEVGFGCGEHLLAQAAANPDVGLIGCEPFLNGVASALAGMETTGVWDNIRLWTEDAGALLDRLPDASLQRCFVLFPDPWPKRRHHKRRFIAPATLDRLARTLRPGGQLRLASDHGDYIRWMLLHATRHRSFQWLAQRASDWLVRPSDQVATRYETKALAGAPYYLCFQRRDAPCDAAATPVPPPLRADAGGRDTAPPPAS